MADTSPVDFDEFNRGVVSRKRIFNENPGGTSGLALNMRKAPFNDIRVRKAFAFLYIIINVHTICSAQILIEGHVKDEETSKGVFATVVLKDVDGKIITYTNTKNEGYFELNIPLSLFITPLERSFFFSSNSSIKFCFI